MNALVEVPKPPASVTAPTPVDLLRMAVSQGADIDKLKQLMDLQERWEKNEARKAFIAAMKQFKANPPEIIKNKQVSFGNTTYSHATLDNVCREVTAALSKVGISHRWKVDQSNGITVTCVLTHELGHSEETALSGAADSSGSKNSIQAIGSTVTYLQRYTLMAATGLAAGSDDDGRAAAPALPKDKLGEQCDWILNARDLDELKKLFSDAYREADKANDRFAMNEYIKAKNRRKAELQ